MDPVAGRWPLRRQVIVRARRCGSTERPRLRRENVAVWPFATNRGAAKFWSLMEGLCCKTRFAQVIKNSAGCWRAFRVKMWGDWSSHVKLTRDFGNEIESMRIGDRLPLIVFAKNLWRCNFRLLQHNPRHSRHWSRWGREAWVSNDAVDGAHSTASMCQRVVASKRTTLRGAVHGRG